MYFFSPLDPGRAETSSEMGAEVFLEIRRLQEPP